MSARRAGEVLRWSLAALDDPDHSAPPSAVGLTDLAERAEYHGISPLVHLIAHRLAGLEPGVRRKLESSYHFAVRRHLFLLNDLADIHGWMQEFDHPWLVVKGPVLAETLYPRSDLRSYTDLDLLVSRAAFDPTLRLLMDHGATPVASDWASLLAGGRGELEVRLATGAVVDLHWTLINMPDVRARFSVEVPRLFESARSVTIEGRGYQTLGLEDSIVHLALHAVLSGGDRLVWVKDLDAAITAGSDEQDWDALSATARAWGALPALAAQLARTHRLLGSRLPVGARRVLAPGRQWARVCELADRFAPPERSRGSLSVAKRVSRATAPTGLGGVVELTRAVGRGVRRASRRPGGGLDDGGAR